MCLFNILVGENEDSAFKKAFFLNHFPSQVHILTAILLGRKQKRVIC